MEDMAKLTGKTPRRTRENGVQRVREDVDGPEHHREHGEQEERQ
jgi:hypothetical protein